MRNRGAIILFGLAVVGAIGLWVYQRGGSGSDSTATGGATGSASAGSSTPAIQPVTAEARPASLEVRVRTSAGPLAGAQVRIAAQDAEVIVAQTDERGVAFVKDLPPATYDISASAKGHVPSAQEQVLAAGQQASLELVLAAGGRSLAGLVTDVSGGPVAGARIDAAKLGGTARPTTAIATAFTGADGRYQLTVPEGALLVAARSADYAPQSRYVDVGPSGATADFALVPGGVIEGVVLDEQTKQPIGGATVQAWRDTPAMMLAEPGGRRVLAGVDGRFRLTGLRPGAYELDARGQGRVSRAPTIVGLGVAEQVVDVTLLVGRGAVVRGKVVDEASTPVGNATVMTLGRRGPEVTTDAKGGFVIEGLPPGKHVLVGRADEHVAAGLTPVEVKEADVDGVIVNVQRGVRVRGHVEPRQPAELTVELEGRRGPGPMLSIGPTAIPTKEDGSFELPPLLPGAAKLSARSATGDQGSVDVTIAQGMPEVVVKLAPGGAIAGRVVDAEGKPVLGASVMATPTGGEERTTIVNGRITSGTQTLTGANGAYELRGLAAATYRLSVLERGQPLRPRAEVAPVKLATGEKKTGVDLAVDRSNGVIKGVVTGPDGKPLADAWVSASQDLHSLVEGLRGPPGPPGPPGSGEGSRMVMIEAQDDDGGGGGGSGLAPVLTDAQGQFTITGLPAGRFEVIAEAQAGKLRGRVGGVQPDATITIKALGVTTLSGTVRGPAGPASLFTIELDGPTSTQRTFTGGAFQLGRVDPGDYTVRVTSSEGNAVAKVTVLPDTPATVDIVLVANAIVVGQVVDAEGQPVAGVDVTTVADAGDGRIQISIDGPPPTTGPDGRFRLEREAGRAALVVLTPPRPTIKRGLVLEAGKTLDVGVVKLEGAPPPKP